MEGLVKEGGEVMEEDMEEDMTEALKDAALIAAAQRVAHYEIAGQGGVRTYATIGRPGSSRCFLSDTR